MKIFDRQKLLDYIARRNAECGIVPTPEKHAALTAFMERHSLAIAAMIVREITGRR